MNHAVHEHKCTVSIVPHPFSFLLFHSVIPKLNCVFTIEIDGFISYIYGSKFQLRSSERSAKKFKVKGTIDLWTLCHWQQMSLATENWKRLKYPLFHEALSGCGRLDSKESRVAEEHWTTQEEVGGRDLSLQGGKTSRKYTRTNLGWFEEGGHLVLCFILSCVSETFCAKWVI